jgi:hypothetical protein
LAHRRVTGHYRLSWLGPIRVRVCISIFPASNHGRRWRPCGGLACALVYSSELGLGVGDRPENGEGLAQRAHDQPEIAHFKITYFSATNGDDAAIGFTSCLPERLFEKTFTLWQGVVFGNRDVTYSIILDFLGFRLEQAKTEKPTLNEWLMGSKPAFGNEIEISFRSQGS